MADLLSLDPPAGEARAPPIGPLFLQSGARGRAALTPGAPPDAVGLDPCDLVFLKYRVQNSSGKIDDLRGSIL
jgi:hypothetical protein